MYTDMAVRYVNAESKQSQGALVTPPLLDLEYGDLDSVADARLCAAHAMRAAAEARAATAEARGGPREAGDTNAEADSDGTQTDDMDASTNV